MHRSFLNLIPNTNELKLIRKKDTLRKTKNYAGFISKPGTDELKMKFFVKNSSILNKIRISCLFSDRQSSFSFLYCLHLFLARAHVTLENMCHVHL